MANIPWNGLEIFAAFPAGVDLEGALSASPQDFGAQPFVRVVIPKGGTLHDLVAKITANTFPIPLTIGVSINAGAPVLAVVLPPLVSVLLANAGYVPVAAGDVVSYRIMGAPVGAAVGIEGSMNVLYTPT